MADDDKSDTQDHRSFIWAWGNLQRWRPSHIPVNHSEIPASSTAAAAASIRNVKKAAADDEAPMDNIGTPTKILGMRKSRSFPNMKDLHSLESPGDSKEMSSASVLQVDTSPPVASYAPKIIVSDEPESPAVALPPLKLGSKSTSRAAAAASDEKGSPKDPGSLMTSMFSSIFSFNRRISKDTSDDEAFPRGVLQTTEWASAAPITRSSSQGTVFPALIQVLPVKFVMLSGTHKDVCLLAQKGDVFSWFPKTGFVNDTRRLKKARRDEPSSSSHSMPERESIFGADTYQSGSFVDIPSEGLAQKLKDARIERVSSGSLKLRSIYLNGDDIFAIDDRGQLVGLENENKKSFDEDSGIKSPNYVSKNMSVFHNFKVASIACGSNFSVLIDCKLSSSVFVH
jgi:hypothetical protein